MTTPRSVYQNLADFITKHFAGNLYRLRQAHGTWRKYNISMFYIKLWSYTLTNFQFHLGSGSPERLRRGRELSPSVESRPCPTTRNHGFKRKFFHYIFDLNLCNRFGIWNDLEYKLEGELVYITTIAVTGPLQQQTELRKGLGKNYCNSDFWPNISSQINCILV